MGNLQAGRPVIVFTEVQVPGSLPEGTLLPLLIVFLCALLTPSCYPNEFLVTATCSPVSTPAAQAVANGAVQPPQAPTPAFLLPSASRAVYLQGFAHCPFFPYYLLLRLNIF